ncbi:MAG: hypothetical protein IR159_02985 [Brevundimonas sp.]|nr:hypothetical protein [Brevundimonas sp.]
MQIATATALVAVFAACPAPQLAESDLTGSWEGRLSFGGQSIRIVFHIQPDGTATVDSPDQGGFGIPAELSVPEPDVVRLSVPRIGGRFEGRLSPDPQTLTGVLVQGTASLPLVLRARPASE